MESQGAASRLGTLVDAHRNDIERRWLAGIARVGAQAAAGELSRLRAGLGAYLTGLAVVLCESRIIRRQGAREIWLEVARARGVTRARGGLDVEQLVHELVVLGRVIRDVAAERGVAMDGPEAVLAEVLDGAISAAVRAYVDTREREARRLQARHVSFLTHELRDPLGTAMLTAAQLRGRQTPVDEGALDRLDRCHERLSNLIERVLRTQTFETEKPTSRPAATTLGQILDGALDRARAAAADKGLDLRVSFDPCVAVTVDPLLTRVAVQRLVEGAVAETEAGWVDVVIEERRDTIILDLRDTCAAVGRADLAIAKRAVEAQGGSLATGAAGAAARHLRLTLPKQAMAPAAEI